MCSSLSNVNSNRHSKAPNSIYLSCNVRSIDYKNPIKVIKANRKDNSQRKFYSPNKLARSIILTHPKYAWN